MSVTITITDPATTDPAEISALMKMLAPFGLEVGSFIEAPRAEAALYVGNELVGHTSELKFTLTPDFDATVPDPSEATAAFAPPPSPVAPPAAPGMTAIENRVFGFDPASLDKEGIPWDGRIHMSTKNRTVENVWKRKRNVPDEEYARVVAELRVSQMAPAAPVVVPPPPPAPVVPVEAVVPPPPPAPTAPAASAATFPEFMAHVTAGVTSQRFTREDITEACVKCGVANLPGLINRPDLIPAVSRELGLIA
jgi:hypothetical protein